MKRFLPILLVSLYLSIIVSLPVNADFDRAYQDYLYQYDQYRRNLTNFLTAKNRYLTYKTLTAQTEALTSTKAFLDSRDQVLITYLQMLLERNPQESFKKLLNDEIQFLSDHKNLIPAVGSLEDSVDVSDKFEEHFPLTEVVARQTVANIVLTKVLTFDNQLTNLIADYEEKINSLKNQGKDVSMAERWLLETKNKQFLARDKIGQAQNLAAKLKPTAYLQESARDYAKIQVLISEANQYLKEAANYLKEIKEELKYGNY